MTDLQKQIRHYKRIAKTSTGNQAHFALGALEVLLKVKELRDAYDEDRKQCWLDRAGLNGDREYFLAKDAVQKLDNLMVQP